MPAALGERAERSEEGREPAGQLPVADTGSEAMKLSRRPRGRRPPSRGLGAEGEEPAAVDGNAPAQPLQPLDSDEVTPDHRLGVIGPHLVHVLASSLPRRVCAGCGVITDSLAARAADPPGAPGCVFPLRQAGRTRGAWGRRTRGSSRCTSRRTCSKKSRPRRRARIDRSPGSSSAPGAPRARRSGRYRGRQIGGPPQRYQRPTRKGSAREASPEGEPAPRRYARRSVAVCPEAGGRLPRRPVQAGQVTACACLVDRCWNPVRPHRIARRRVS